MSHWISVFGRRLNSSHVSRTGLSTNPSMRKSQVRRSTRGTSPYCSTGHFSVRDCPGGNRPSLRRCCSSFFRSLPSPKIIFARSSCCAKLYLTFGGTPAFLNTSSEKLAPPLCYHQQEQRLNHFYRSNRASPHPQRHPNSGSNLRRTQAGNCCTGRRWNSSW